MRKRSYISGIGLIEVIVSVAIIALSLIGIIGAFNFYIKAGIENTDKIRAAYLLEEGVEAVRFLRDGGFSVNITGLSIYSPYYLSLEGSVWKATTTASLIDNTFDRIFILGDVYRRNSDDDIVASTSAEAKTLDAGSKEVAVRVSWNDEEIEAITYMTNLFEM